MPNPRNGILLSWVHQGVPASGPVTGPDPCPTNEGQVKDLCWSYWEQEIIFIEVAK